MQKQLTFGRDFKRIHSPSLQDRYWSNKSGYKNKRIKICTPIKNKLKKFFQKPTLQIRGKSSLVYQQKYNPKEQYYSTARNSTTQISHIQHQRPSYRYQQLEKANDYDFPLTRIKSMSNMPRIPSFIPARESYRKKNMQFTFGR